jgi:hypothetical protein
MFQLKSSSFQSPSPQSQPAGFDALHASTLSDPLGAPVQADTGAVPPNAAAIATAGAKGPGGPLPHLDKLQPLFGEHDLSGVRAHTGASAEAANAVMGSNAMAHGNDVLLRDNDLHTVAHEAAHVIQQQGGVQLAGGVGAAGDAYEQHADAVADRVVRGESAADLLSSPPGGGGQTSAVQMMGGKELLSTAGGLALGGLVGTGLALTGVPLAMTALVGGGLGYLGSTMFGGGETSTTTQNEEVSTGKQKLTDTAETSKKKPKPKPKTKRKKKNKSDGNATNSTALLVENLVEVDEEDDELGTVNDEDVVVDSKDQKDEKVSVVDDDDGWSTTKTKTKGPKLPLEERLEKSFVDTLDLMVEKVPPVRGKNNGPEVQGWLLKRGEEGHDWVYDNVHGTEVSVQPSWLKSNEVLKWYVTQTSQSGAEFDVTAHVWRDGKDTRETALVLHVMK